MTQTHTSVQIQTIADTLAILSMLLVEVSNEDGPWHVSEGFIVLQHALGHVIANHGGNNAN